MLTCVGHAAITTVGYGEITPRSILGRLITVPLLAFGLLLIALPSFVLGREFSIVWDQMIHGEVGLLDSLTHSVALCLCYLGHPIRTRHCRVFL